MNTEENKRELKFRSLYEGVWYYQTLEDILSVTLGAGVRMITKKKFMREIPLFMIGMIHGMVNGKKKATWLNIKMDIFSRYQITIVSENLK